MAEEKDKKMQVYFPEEDADTSEKKLAVSVLDFYIKEIEK